jgi:hypothetical protein
VITAYEMGWSALENGKLLAAAQAAGFDAMITSDANIRHQQNLTGLRLALIVLTTNHWPTIQGGAQAVLTAVTRAQPGSYTSIPFDRPPLRRRSRTPPDG